MSKKPKNSVLENVELLFANRKIQTSFGFDDNFEPKNIELFAGAGGFGAGAALAGLHFDIAINHNPAALAVHKVNFPHTTQMINDVFEHNPIDVLIASGVPAYILEGIKNWRKKTIEKYAANHLHLSPDCTFHSRAKGKKKVLARHTSCGDDCSLIDHSQLSQETADRIRGLAWVGIGWAAVARPKRITLENVSEFMNWGPTITDKDGDIVPDEKRAGETFEAFKGILGKGIDKNHPAVAEMRKFLKPFLGDDYNEKELIKGLGYDVEFKELVACDYGAPTSRKRLFMIARCDGVTISWPKKSHGDPMSAEVQSGKLLPWRGAAECIDWSVIAPSIFDSKDEVKERFGITVKRPLVDNSMRRIANGIKKFVLEASEPFVIKVNHSGNGFRGQPIDEPLQTITSKNGYGIAVPYITGIDNASSGASSVWSGERPLTTIVTEARHALTAAYIMNSKGSDVKRMPIGNSASQPMTTITASDSHGVVFAHLKREFGQSIGAPVNNPFPTITAGGGGKTSLVASYCIKMKGDNLGYGCNEPVQTITAGGLAHGVVSSHLYKYYGDDKYGQSIKEPIHTIRTKDCFGLITESLASELPLDDDLRYKAWQVARMMEVYANYGTPMLGGISLPRVSCIKMKDGSIIYDIGMRMLSERELFTAQGFQKSFVYDPEVVVTNRGKKVIRKITKTEAVRMVGNSVPPHFATALIAALDEAEEKILTVSPF